MAQTLGLKTAFKRRFLTWPRDPRARRIWLKQFLPKSLLGRTLTIVVTPLILLQIVTAFVFFERHWDTVGRRLANSLTGEISTVIAFYRNYPASEQNWITTMAERHFLLRIQMEPGATLPNPDTEIEYRGIMMQALARALTDNIRRPFRLSETADGEFVNIRLQLPEGVMTIVTPRKRLFSSTTYVFVLWMVGTSLLLVVIATVFMRNQVRPVHRLAVAADNFGKGRDAGLFKPEGATEVRRAAQAFIVMRDRIRRHIDERTAMLAGVSHDLRTPLTRMKLQLAMMAEDSAKSELIADIDEMERMINGYLDFARGEGREDIRAVAIDDAVIDVVNRFRREGATIDLHIEERMLVPLRPHAFERCLSNLLGNATRFGTTVALRVGQRDEACEIVIDDDGPGIPEDSREDVFKPFVRLDNSRNPETGGTGLGLAIARDVVRGHGGEIFLEDGKLGGLRVRLSLPL